METMIFCREYWQLYDQRLRIQDEMQDISPANRDRLLAEYAAVTKAIEAHRRECRHCRVLEKHENATSARV
jgi:hypothetical protein